MVVYAFYIFDRHGRHGHIESRDSSLIMKSAECIYKKKWTPRPTSTSKTVQINGASDNQKTLSAEDDAKLVFGTIFSLRNLVKKIGGPDDRYFSEGLTVIVRN